MSLATLELLKSADRRLRAAVLTDGLFRYARSRLTPGAYETFVGWARYHRLPTTGAEARSTADSAQSLQALVDLVRGLIEPVTTATLPYLSIQVSANTTVSATLTVRGGASLDNVNCLGALDSEVAGDVVVGDDVKTIDGFSAETLRCASINTVENSAIISGTVLAGSVGITKSTLPRDVAAMGTGAWALFEDFGSRLTHWKMNNVGFANDKRALLGCPGFDTGWFEVSMHLTGDPAANPPYEMTYPLNVTLDAGVIGDRYGVTDAEVFLRDPVRFDGNGPHVAPGVSQYGWPTNPGAPYYSPVHPLQDAPVVGTQIVVHSSGQVRIRVGLVGSRLVGSTLRTQMRAFLWLRGQS